MLHGICGGGRSSYINHSSFVSLSGLQTNTLELLFLGEGLWPGLGENWLYSEQSC